MKLTIFRTGEVPEALRAQFGTYPAMFERMFAGSGMTFDVVDVPAGAPLPDPATLDAVLITGSAAGVNDGLDWLEPLKAFIRRAYAERLPMLGVCFGHQIMAAALGGTVARAPGGWGIGQHSYDVVARPDFLADLPDTITLACSHQDQVISRPPEAETVFTSAFTPFAGLFYANGAAFSVQPHPEFDKEFALALAHLRKGQVPDALIEAAEASFDRSSDRSLIATRLAGFLAEAYQRRTRQPA